ncbi:MAG: GNAT family N-acetyltransferase [Acidobacteria bacterium]|nr:GNAT family N-acetyltransferase [Acidobacteriota bacterium]
MILPDGYTDLPAGKIAAVVTFLEMRAKPAFEPLPLPAGLSIRDISKPDLDCYRRLFRAVGEEWLWFSRLRMSDDELAAIIHDPRVDVFALEHQGVAKVLIELDRREPPDVELAFFGVTTDLIGTGAGRCLMQFAIEQAWSHKPRRFWVHTCTLDHPKALAFYIKSCFVACKRAIELAGDPRLTGDLPRTAAPHIPIIGR